MKNRRLPKFERTVKKSVDKGEKTIKKAKKKKVIGDFDFSNEPLLNEEWGEHILLD